MEDKIAHINSTLERWFEDNPDIPELPAIELMDVFVREGVFNKNYSNGMPIRVVLRKLDDQNRLEEIPYAYCIRKAKYRYWYFKKV